jgi:hypothetical protein
LDEGAVSPPLRRLHWETWGRAPLSGNLKNELFEGYIKCPAGGASLSMGAPVGKPGGGLLVEDPDGYERRALGTGTSLYGGSVRATCGGLIYWDFKIWMKEL